MTHALLLALEIKPFASKECYLQLPTLLGVIFSNSWWRLNTLRVSLSQAQAQAYSPAQ